VARAAAADPLADHPHGRLQPRPPTGSPDGRRSCTPSRSRARRHTARAGDRRALRESGDLDGEPTPTQRKANFYERGEKPLEIVTTRQWYIRNGGRDADLKPRCSRAADQIAFHPGFMRVRYENWVKGLNGDWLISRQRFFGVPDPGLVPLDDDGEPDYDDPIVPSEDQLPIDPSAHCPPGLHRGPARQARRIRRRPDVMDTWATSSLTPQIAPAGAGGDPELFAKIFPMDLRPQAHDIIRTWLFSTWCAPLEHGSPAVDQCGDLRLDPRPGPQEDEQVQGQRRHPEGMLVKQHGSTRCATGRPAAGSAPTRRSTSAR
jgi:valyl-tRNA synthetase